MSTRSQICIKRNTPGFAEAGGIYIYKHSDGYPEGVMPILKPFVKRFVEQRGDDPAYLLCQIVRQFAASELKEERGFASKDSVFPYGDCTGWGLDAVEHGDIEYLYEIDSQTGNIYINGKLDRKDWSKK